MLANGLLDVLTNGEHTKAMSDLYDMQCLNYEQAEVQKCFNETSLDAAAAAAETREQIEEEYEKYKYTTIDFNRLRSLNDIGIDVSFLDNIEAEMKNFELTRRLQEHLSNNLNLIEKLRATQNERLSQPLPPHLSQVQPPGQEETHLASQITQHLSDLAKKLPPAAIADPYSVRRAMGMSFGKYCFFFYKSYLMKNTFYIKFYYLQWVFRSLYRSNSRLFYLKYCNRMCPCRNCI